MAKEIQQGYGAQSKAVEALKSIAGIVGSTLGPGGRTVLISRKTTGSTTTVSHTKDGFNVLTSLQYVDPVLDAVHKLCLQASGNSVLASGDGTTSTLVAAAAFASALTAEDRNPQATARKLRKEIEAAIEAIKQEAVPGTEAAYRVAVTSANGDEELTDIVLDALAQSSAYGTVIVEKSAVQKERYKIDKEFGYQSGDGYGYYMQLAQSIHETIANQAQFVMRDSFVVPYNGDILSFTQINNIITQIAQANSVNGTPKFKLYICAYEISEDVAAQVAYMNRKNQHVKIFLGKTTRTAEINGAFQQLNDIAAFSGAKVVDAGSASYWTAADAGKVNLVRVGPHKTFLLGKNENNWIEERAKQNEETASLAQSQMDRDIINSRNASLTGGCVKIIIGGGLMSDLQERADRADDAIKATQAAMRSGALPGCGASYIRAGQLAKVSGVLKEALAAIHTQIMDNYGEAPAETFERGETFYIGNDSIRRTADFLEAGVADSFETVQAVLRNGFELGLLVANLGGYSLEANLAELEQVERARDVLGSVR